MFRWSDSYSKLFLLVRGNVWLIPSLYAIGVRAIQDKATSMRFSGVH
jgi:hypothetical protein